VIGVRAARASQFLEYKLASGPIAATEVGNLKGRFSTPAVDSAVASLALVDVRIGGGKGSALATREQAAELGRPIRSL